MGNVYIFGDSFFMKTHHKYAWPNRLLENYQVYNYAEGGLGNYEIFLRFLNCLELFKNDDVIIFGWSDPNRFYLNPNLQKTDKIYKIYYENFYNKTLNEIHQNALCNEIKNIVKERTLKILFLWSFPTDYTDVDKENFNWLDSVMCKTSYEQYLYRDTFLNEVRPALIYFSMKEIGKVKKYHKAINHFVKDFRPNHIADQEVHNAIYDIVSQFIEGRITGQIDLLKRITNG